MRKAFPVLLLIILLSSCMTVQENGDRPAWVDNPPSVLFSTVIVGEGEGQSADEADMNAYLDILSSLSEKAGVDYTRKYYDELSETDMISSFDTVITTKYRTEKDGIFYSYMLSTTDTLLLDEVSANDYSILFEREERVREKVSQSLSYYRNNEDVKAINALLEAVEISLEGEIVSADYQTSVLVERLEKYVSQIGFEFVGKGSKKDNEPFFRIYRNKGVMHPPVEDAAVRVSYPSLNAEGKVTVLEYDARSDEDGIVVVNRTNAYALRKGTMSITIDVDETVMSRIDSAAGEELLSRFRTLLDEIVFSSEYRDEETYGAGEAVIALALYGYDGTSVSITSAAAILEDMCALFGIENVETVEALGDDEEEVLSYLKENYAFTDVIYMVRIGIVDRVHTLGTWYTKTEGKIVKIDNRSGKSEEYSTMQYSTANDGEESDDSAALFSQIRITLSFVLGEF